MTSNRAVHKAEAKDESDRAIDTSDCSGCPLSRFAIYGPTVLDNPDRFQFGRMSVRTYGPNQTILAEGHTSSLLGTVRSGWAQMLKNVRAGRRHSQGVLVPGDFLAVDLLYTGDQPVSFSVKALTDVTVCWFEADTMRRLLGTGDKQRAWTQFWTYYYFTFLHARAANVAEQDASGRLAHFFVEIVDRLSHRQIGQRPTYEIPPDEVVVRMNVEQQAEHRTRYQTNMFDFPLTQAQISQCLGLTPVHVNRVLRQFADERLLEIRQKKLCVYDMQKLTRIAAEGR